MVSSRSVSPGPAAPKGSVGQFEEVARPAVPGDEGAVEGGDQDPERGVVEERAERRWRQPLRRPGRPPRGHHVQRRPVPPPGPAHLERLEDPRAQLGVVFPDHRERRGQAGRVRRGSPHLGVGVPGGEHQDLDGRHRPVHPLHDRERLRGCGPDDQRPDLLAGAASQRGVEAVYPDGARGRDQAPQPALLVGADRDEKEGAHAQVPNRGTSSSARPVHVRRMSVVGDMTWAARASRRCLSNGCRSR